MPDRCASAQTWVRGARRLWLNLKQRFRPHAHGSIRGCSGANDFLTLVALSRASPNVLEP